MTMTKHKRKWEIDFIVDGHDFGLDDDGITITNEKFEVIHDYTWGQLLLKLKVKR